MDNALVVILGGVTGAALVKLLDNLIQSIITRFFKNRDKKPASLKTIYAEIQSLRAENEKQFHALRVSMYDRISYLVHKAIAEQEVPLGLRTDVNRLYDSYKEDLGANGDLASEMELFLKLPIKAES